MKECTGAPNGDNSFHHAANPAHSVKEPAAACTTRRVVKRRLTSAGRVRGPEKSTRESVNASGPGGSGLKRGDET